MDADQENLELADSAKIPETEAQEKRDNQAGAQLTKALKAIVVWSILLLLIVPPFGILAFVSACLTKLSKTEKKRKIFIRISKICCIAGTVALAIGMTLYFLK